jgi:RNA polymerase sigma-70 factor (ECF subfamily)
LKGSGDRDQLFRPRRVVMANDSEDARLVEDCRRGDDRAFEILVHRHSRTIFGAIYRMVRHYEDARDLSQTVFLKAYRELDSYDPRYKFFSWIYRIALNEALNHVKRAGRHEPLGDAEVVSGRSGPERVAEGSETSRLVQEALMRVKPDFRAVLVLRHFMDCSYQDIASILGIPEKTVKSRLFDARRELRELLSERGVRR